MINGIEGIPGSGKSYEATVFHVLHALKNGRQVITNLPLIVEKFASMEPAYEELIVLRKRTQPIRGIWDANRMDEDGKGNAFELFADGHTEDPSSESRIRGHDSSGRERQNPPPELFGSVWDYYTTWKHPKTGQGPLFVIDECHVGMPKIGTPREVIQWFKLHRHFNCDVLLMTQNFRDMCPEIATLMEMLIKCRKATFLGKPGEYVRKVHAGYRGAAISTDQRKYQKQYYGLYKSHTQGNSVAESLAPDVAPFIVGFRKYTKIVWVLCFASMVLLIWTLSKNKSGTPPHAAQSMSANVAAAPSALRATDAPRNAPTPPPAIAASGPPRATIGATTAVEVYDPEPLAGKGVHLRGKIAMGTRTEYIFAASQNGTPVMQMTSKDLAAMGYEWKPTSECTGVLWWRGKSRTVTCDLATIHM